MLINAMSELVKASKQMKSNNRLRFQTEDKSTIHETSIEEIKLRTQQEV